MGYLPAIKEASTVIRLPLSAGSAVGLAKASLTPAGPERTAALLPALLIDPVLSQWSVLQARQQDEEIRTVAEAAAWLSANLSALCADESPGTAMEITEAVLQRAADLAGQCVERATRSLGENASIGERSCSAVYLLALLDDAACWFDLGGDESRRRPTSPARSTDKPLPLSIASMRAAAAWTGKSDLQPLLGTLLRNALRLDRLEGQFQRELQTAKLDAMKELAYGAGHEINNPLANISARAQMLLKEEEDPDRRRKLAAINTQAFRAHEMIADLMLFARPPRLDLTTVDVQSLLDKVIKDVVAEMASREIELQRPGAEAAVYCEGDSTQLYVAVKALVTNAIEAIGRGGWIRAEALQRDREVRISIRDNGPGITTAIRDRIFDPFFSGREAGRGLGFGLSKCWRIVTDHGGRIEVESEPGLGAMFTISLPLKPQDSAGR